MNIAVACSSNQTVSPAPVCQSTILLKDESLPVINEVSHTSVNFSAG